MKQTVKQFPRDYAMYAFIFGIFGFSWFGWGQASPPGSWRIFLGVASGLCFIIAAIGGFLAVQHWQSPSAITSDKHNYLRFRNIVIVEFVLCLFGGLMLTFLKLDAYIAPYILLIVGLHFIPLAKLFQDKQLVTLAGCVAVGAVSSVFLAPLFNISVTTIACIMGGVLLCIFAIRGLYKFSASRRYTL